MLLGVRREWKADAQIGVRKLGARETRQNELIPFAILGATYSVVYGVKLASLVANQES